MATYRCNGCRKHFDNANPPDRCSGCEIKFQKLLTLHKHTVDKNGNIKVLCNSRPLLQAGVPSTEYGPAVTCVRCRALLLQKQMEREKVEGSSDADRIPVEMEGFLPPSKTDGKPDFDPYNLDAQFGVLPEDSR